MSIGNLLVVGAQPDSLGMAVADAWHEAGGVAVTAGIQREDIPCDVLADSIEQLESLMIAAEPHHLVCTVGLNMPEPRIGHRDPVDWYRWHFETNVIGPMRLLEAFSDWAVQNRTGVLRHYVGISSNSATIPRSLSAAYCASKAAFSQALRVKAREAKGGDKGFLVYGYEPGLLAGTPMTEKTREDFPGMPLHRMRGEALASGVSVGALAAQIVAGLRVPGAALNGMLVRYDGGEV